MGRNRLKRLKFHSQLCVATLAIVLFAGYVRISGSILNALIAAAIALACCIVLKGTDVGIRSVKDLIRRNLPTVLVPALTVFRTQWGLKTVFMALLLGVVLLFVWSFLAKRWICHEVTPGWTLLIYDSEENLRRVDTIAKSRPDLIENAGTYRYRGKQDTPSEPGASSHIDLAEIDHLVRVFRIPQMVICMEHGEEVQEYCRENGILAFLPEDVETNGTLLYPDKIRCVRPKLQK